MRARASEGGMRMKKGETAAVVIINAGGFCCLMRGRCPAVGVVEKAEKT